jgi:hypothetical protein
MRYAGSLSSWKDRVGFQPPGKGLVLLPDGQYEIWENYACADTSVRRWAGRGVEVIGVFIGDDGQWIAYKPEPSQVKQPSSADLGVWLEEESDNK